MTNASALKRQRASDLTARFGWRYLLGALRTMVPVSSMTDGVEVAAVAVAACGADVSSLRVDLRPTHVDLTLYPPSITAVTAVEARLAGTITEALDRGGWTTTMEGPRSVQITELAIDASDRDAIRPFWKAALGYVDEPTPSGQVNAIVDPLWQGPAIWFQTMDPPRTDRNRIHFDICVPHDEAERRVAAALAAGGRLVSDAAAPRFWILADAEGNEACVTTWQGRD
ncbi:VOC family protein [Stackebrandtia soli]|uniref:VOC family protein n=1 Tax=Stackebrandtia soli TaxID=1892856 RepID=UPI0039E7DC9E